MVIFHSYVSLPEGIFQDGHIAPPTSDVFFWYGLRNHPIFHRGQVMAHDIGALQHHLKWKHQELLGKLGEML